MPQPAPAPAPEGVPAPAPRASLAARYKARWWLYTLWIALGLLAVSGFWTQSHGGGLGVLVRTFGYLALCGAALLLPGFLADLASLPIETRRTIALVTLIVAAGLAAGSIAAKMLWAAPPFILLAGNSIWTIDTIDLELEARKRAEAERQSRR